MNAPVMATIESGLAHLALGRLLLERGRLHLSHPPSMVVNQENFLQCHGAFKCRVRTLRAPTVDGVKNRRIDASFPTVEGLMRLISRRQEILAAVIIYP